MRLTEKQMDGMGMPPKAKVIMYEVYINYDIAERRWKMERDWIGIHYLWEEMEFGSYTDYAIFNMYLSMGKWK